MNSFDRFTGVAYRNILLDDAYHVRFVHHARTGIIVLAFRGLIQNKSVDRPACAIL